MPNKAELQERLAAAIERRIPQDANRKAWLRRQALEVGIPYDTFCCHATGENEPGASTLLAYFVHFGPVFEAEIRGGNQKPNWAAGIESLMADIEAVVAKHKGKAT